MFIIGYELLLSVPCLPMILHVEQETEHNIACMFDLFQNNYNQAHLPDLKPLSNRKTCKRSSNLIYSETHISHIDTIDFCYPDK
jgi:hypothetical protein